MLKVICSISVLLSSVILTACGQSGALQLPSDQNHDKRAKYLLYKNEATPSTVKAEEAKVEDKAISSSTQSQTISP
ncbi:lipoprotein [Acinetobacter sp. C26M]|uniref:LPS translocon maturation chaperone LptM n=1 Tax=unclassified Acinetobacter TaxID=196816 RepID=UPI0014247CB3|nr:MULTISPECIES: lipoprotein [unclassified Acinetobacter]NIE96104.1 lipoprotein [Acinetobacter sp. Tr-809]USA47631.1 lipoprotein [Acinetobacter sp. C26M]USA51112.1 lipoprotein [Acinetobacter sp. C26G]